jgi:arylsulfatase
MTEKDKADARKVYAMVTNIDDNIGKLLKKLDELNIAENTLIIFMTDNGPQQTRYVAGMRGLKGNVYQGGIRVPFYIRHPSSFGKNKEVEIMAAHLDILPTVAEICNVELPNDRVIDGKSLIPLIKGKQVDWANRSLFTYWTRRYPELYSKMSLHKGNFKLVGNTDYNAKIEDFELYDLEKDSYEQKNIILERKDLATSLKQELDRTYNDLISSKNLINQPPIIVGSKFENPVILNRNDAGGDRGIWDQEEVNGNWKIKIQKGNYNIKFKFIKPLKANGRMYLEANTIVRQFQNTTEGTDIIEMKNLHFLDMECELRPYYNVDSKNIFPFSVEMEKID